MTKQFATIPEALSELSQGRMVILVDDEKRENEGDLVIAAEFATPDVINFMAKYGRGLICMPLPAEQIERLELPLMVADNQAKFNTAFTISVGAAQGITTGISAQDRAKTVQVLLNPQATRADIALPGHVFPLRAERGGVLARPGHTEGSIDLARLAGLQPGAVICEILNEDGSMARIADLDRFAQQHQLKIVTIRDIINYRKQQEMLVEELASAKLPLELYGDFYIKTFACAWDPQHHIALISANLDVTKPVYVRIHSECLTGDIFGSVRCDCGWQLQTSLSKIAEQQGVFIYLRQEGRGIGLTNKIKAYALQEQGLDTVEANHQLGFSADLREYTIAAQILRYLQITHVKLLTNNPKKLAALVENGIAHVEHAALEMPTCAHRQHYLTTKRDKLGHLLNFLKSDPS